MADHSFSKMYRLRNQQDFDCVFAQKCRVSDEWMVVYAWTNDLSYPRLGICASRKLGNAVCRNRWKRLVREAFRLSKEDLPEGLDLIVIPQLSYFPHLDELRRELKRLAHKLAEKVQRQTSRLERESRSSQKPPIQEDPRSSSKK